MFNREHLKPLTLIWICLFVAAHLQGQVRDTLINNGSYKLHFKILPGHNDPILLESGGGLDLHQWDSIAITLHDSLKATIICYDRQGFGKSTLDTSQFNISNEVIGLENDLYRLGYSKKKFILVCHSLGAFYSRLYAARHPRQVKGIVMLDPRIPSLADMAFSKRVFNQLNRTQFNTSQLGLYFVLKNMEANSTFLRGISVPSQIPILDIMAETGPYDSLSDNKRFKSDQRKFVKENANRRLIFARGSDHNIPRDKPILVEHQIILFYRKFSGVKSVRF